ncbi:MAG: sigma-70 family RNA polymerase sigma factor [Pirellulales bacterium]|nr:sigma-70 family RNA polymerase sigma factor [Pirellulales bacterium]
MIRNETDTDALVERARTGDVAARENLLVRHRGRLRRMVAVRMDRRLAARLDPSDVIQEALTEAAVRLPDYLEHRPMPFYPWLRQLTWDCLIRLHREHIYRQKRSVAREEDWEAVLADESARLVADQLLARPDSPIARLARREMLERVQAAMDELDPKDREILVLKYLEQLTTEQISAVLGITPAAVKSRHFRAIQRVHRRLAP